MSDPAVSPSTTTTTSTAAVAMGFPPSPVLFALEQIISEWQKVDHERTLWQIHQHHLLTKIDSLENGIKEKDKELNELRKKVELLEYGVRHERAMRMSYNKQGDKENNTQATDRDTSSNNSSRHKTDEKEQLVSSTIINASNPSSSLSVMKKKKKSQLQYFTLPSRLPVSAHLSVQSFPLWKDYMQQEGKAMKMDMETETQQQKDKKKQITTNSTNTTTTPAPTGPSGSGVRPSAMKGAKAARVAQGSPTSPAVSPDSSPTLPSAVNAPTTTATSTASVKPANASLSTAHLSSTIRPVSPPPPKSAPPPPPVGAHAGTLSKAESAALSSNPSSANVTISSSSLSLHRKKHISFADDDDTSSSPVRPSITNTNIFLPPTEDEVKDHNSNSNNSNSSSNNNTAKPKLFTPSINTPTPTTTTSTPNTTGGASTTTSSSSSSTPLSTLSSAVNNTFKALKPKLSLKNHVDAIRCVTFDQSNPSLSTAHASVLGSASEDGTAKLWSLSTALSSAVFVSKKSSSAATKVPEPFFTFRAHHGPVLSILVQSSARRCVTSGLDGYVNIWDFPTLDVDMYAAFGQCEVNKRRGIKHPKAVWSMCSTDNVLVAACADGAVYVWDISTAADSATTPTPLHIVRAVNGSTSSVPTSVSLTSQSHQLVAGYTTGEVAVIDIEHGTIIHTMKDTTHSTTDKSPHVTSVVPHPTDHTVYTAHADHCIRLFDLHTATPVTTINAHTDCVTSLSLHPASLLLASASHDETIRVWDCNKNHKPVQSLEPHQTHRSKYNEAIHSVCWAQQNNTLASGGADAIVKVYV